jgi:rubrerythrin
LDNYSSDFVVIRMLQEVMMDENAAAKNLDLIASLAPNAQEQSQLHAIRMDDRRHCYFLQDIYEEITGDNYSAGIASVSLPTNYCDMIRAVLYDKIKAAVTYEQLACNLACFKQKDMVCFILNDEKHHARMLAAIYQRCAKKMAGQPPFNQVFTKHHCSKESSPFANEIFNPSNTINY